MPDIFKLITLGKWSHVPFNSPRLQGLWINFTSLLHLGCQSLVDEVAIETYVARKESHDGTVLIIKQSICYWCCVTFSHAATTVTSSEEKWHLIWPLTKVAEFHLIWNIFETELQMKIWKGIPCAHWRFIPETNHFPFSAVYLKHSIYLPHKALPSGCPFHQEQLRLLLNKIF